LLFQAILIGQPPSVGSLEFNLPFNGDTITVRIYDQDQANGASVSLVVAPVPQSILIDSPRAGALVGSPMTITGRTVSFPANGQLTYRVTTAVGGQLGEGSFPVGANSTSGSQFNAQIKFSVPREGGIVQLTISDPTAPTGAVETTIDLDVRPQYQRIDINTAGRHAGQQPHDYHRAHELVLQQWPADLPRARRRQCDDWLRHNPSQRRAR
jgi:hypothetical protein